MARVKELNSRQAASKFIDTTHFAAHHSDPLINFAASLARLLHTEVFPVVQEPIYRVRLVLPSLKAIRGLAVDNECMPIRKRADGQIEMEAIVPEATLQKLKRMKAREVYVEVLAKAEAKADEPSKLVSRSNRYADGSWPRGQGGRKS